MLDNIEAFKNYAQALAEIAEAAYQRISLAGRRQEATIL